MQQQITVQNKRASFGYFIKNNMHVVLATSIALCLIASIIMIAKGFRSGIDFAGGTLIEYKYKSDTEGKDINYHKLMGEKLGTDNFILQSAGPDSFLFKIGSTGDDADIENLKSAISAIHNNNVTFNLIESVGPQVGKELIKQSLIAIVFAFLSILVYMIVRFNWQFALSGVIVLLQNVILSFGFISLFGLELSLTLIAAILTLIGYCINDTVVIYDRIRSNLLRHIGKNVDEVIALSISETVRRSIITSVVTIMSLIGIMFFSDSAIKNFAFIVTFGIVVGTVGSITTASILPIYLRFTRPTFSNDKTPPKDPLFYAS